MLMNRTLWFLSLVGVLGFSASCALRAPVRGRDYLEPTNVRHKNVEFVDGSTLKDALFQNWSSRPALSDWSTDEGFKGFCGVPILVTASSGARFHGRLVVFDHVATGEGPAGDRGDYLLEVTDDKLVGTRGARMTLAVEYYRFKKDPKLKMDVPSEGPWTATAWAIWISTSPIPCKADQLGVERRPVPKAWDINQVSVDRVLAVFTKQIVETNENLHLMGFEAENVSLDGIADLSAGGRFVFEFATSKSSSLEALCSYSMELSRDGIRLEPTYGVCSRKAGKTPSCAAREVWNRAIQRGADPTSKANIRWKGGRWTLAVGGKTIRINDKCK
jgi:hypothetical protein